MLCREMGYTRREFLANFDSAFSSAGYRRLDAATIEIPVENGRVVIRLGEDRVRRIASLSLPVITVDFRFDNLDSEQRARFDAAFRRSFQKGGG
ncbi:MAG: hypothetical protein DWQ08_01010 [Proteobacteria bacterium]|nr:MAG: hypothetical protein DWQ08_01010 [Pseudomonadota bacterium]